MPQAIGIAAIQGRLRETVMAEKNLRPQHRGSAAGVQRIGHFGGRIGKTFHVHEDLEQTYVLEGSLVDDEGECTAGNFVIRAKGSRHAPTAPNGCTMLVFFLKPTEGLKKALLKRG